MVFQRPNPFPQGVYDNVAFGPRVLDLNPVDLDEVMEQSLRRAAVWEQTQDHLHDSALDFRWASSSVCASRACWRCSPR